MVHLQNNRHVGPFAKWPTERWSVGQMAHLAGGPEQMHLGDLVGEGVSGALCGEAGLVEFLWKHDMHTRREQRR